MKSNVISTSAACIFIGLGGFMIGKLTSGKAEMSEHERLLQSSERFIQQRSTDDGMKSRAGKNTNRPRNPDSEIGLDQKLANMEEIVRGESALKRGRAMLEWIDSLAPEDFEGAVLHFRSLGLTRTREGEYEMLLTAWAEVDPLSAIACVKGNTGMAASAVLSTWARRDPDAAIAWVKANHKDNHSDYMSFYMTGVIRGLAETDLARATALYQEFPNNGETIDILKPHILEKGADAAKKWIASLTNEAVRRQAIARFAEILAKQDPAGTVPWLVENLSGAPASSLQTLGTVFTALVKQDPAAAMANFESIPEGKARSYAFKGLVMANAYENPQASADMLSRFPADVTDPILQNFAAASSHTAPEISLNHIRMIQHEETRNSVYFSVLHSWLRRDRAAAQNWINSANLPTSVIENLARNQRNIEMFNEQRKNWERSGEKVNPLPELFERR